ncbi:hypothetical protein PV328_001298 [Microctonus aethiopoides]|uniref:Uncharacterized protein n=1 Tax=Microctonus aethiopoides TaxID=144406 RepID=A0AA39KXE9_9HYME|nr:hypothetical protein PV328_001298 [Microctonus aethiopoides]
MRTTFLASTIKDASEEFIVTVASNDIINDFYVNNLLISADDIGKAKLSDAEITQLLADREFQLQKWTSQWTRRICFVALIAFYVKTKLQNLWQLKQDWDDCLLQELHTKWNQYQQGLVHLKDIEIPRCTLREHAQHSNHIPIMCEIYSYAIKKLTLARFALCAALLLALLPKKVTKRLNTNLNGRYF